MFRSSLLFLFLVTTSAFSNEASGQALSPNSCLGLNLKRFEISSDCKSTRTANWQGRIDRLNSQYRNSTTGQIAGQPIENVVFGRVCAAKFEIDGQTQIGAYTGDNYHVVPHQADCRKEGVIMECGPYTSSALVSCRPMSGETFQDIPRGCNFSVTFMRTPDDELRSKRLKCTCNHLGCGQAVLDDFPKEISEERLREALAGHGCGEVDIKGYSESQQEGAKDEKKVFLLTTEKCHIATDAVGDCGPKSKPRYLFKPNWQNKTQEGVSIYQFPVICVPETPGTEGQGTGPQES